MIEIDRYNRNRSEIEGLRRIDKRDYPSEALRETLLNLLVHRDYAFSDSTLVSIFDDRIEFVSIGGFVKGISYDDMLLGVSAARNKNLANFSVKPKIEVTDNAFKITLPNMNEAAEKIFLNENERSVMNLFAGKDFIVRKDVEEKLSVSQAMAVRVLRGLTDKGEIRAVGGGKGRRYSVRK